MTIYVDIVLIRIACALLPVNYLFHKKYFSGKS